MSTPREKLAKTISAGLDYFTPDQALEAADLILWEIFRVEQHRIAADQSAKLYPMLSENLDLALDETA